jgi:hypothetical protein
VAENRLAEAEMYAVEVEVILRHVTKSASRRVGLAGLSHDWSLQLEDKTYMCSQVCKCFNTRDPNQLMILHECTSKMRPPPSRVFQSRLLKVLIRPKACTLGCFGALERAWKSGTGPLRAPDLVALKWLLRQNPLNLDHELVFIDNLEAN